MRHQRRVKKLGRTASHRKAMLRNLVTSLIREERVVTTHSKALVARSVTERYITKARKGGLANLRLVARDIHDEAALKKLFTELGPRFADRPGGYTRILRMGQRDGDAAFTSMLELLGAPEVKDKAEKEPAKGKKGRREREASEREAEAAGGAEEKASGGAEARSKAEDKAAKKEKRAEEKARKKAAKAERSEKGGPGDKGPGGKGGGGTRRRLGFGRKTG